MYEFLPHTADIRMRVTAPALPELFRDALRGLMAVLQPRTEGADRVQRTIAVESADRTALLVDFLNEALALALTNRESYEDVAIVELDAGRAILRATLDGRRASGFGDDVKAVTYHEANLVHGAGGWQTLVVFDI